MVNMLSPRKVNFVPVSVTQPLSRVTIVNYFTPISKVHIRCINFYLVNYNIEDNKHEILEKLAALYDLSRGECRWRPFNSRLSDYEVTVTSVYDNRGIDIPSGAKVYDYTDLENQLFDMPNV